MATGDSIAPGVLEQAQPLTDKGPPVSASPLRVDSLPGNTDAVLKRDEDILGMGIGQGGEGKASPQPDTFGGLQMEAGSGAGESCKTAGVVVGGDGVAFEVTSISAASAGLADAVDVLKVEQQLEASSGSTPITHGAAEGAAVSGSSGDDRLEVSTSLAPASLATTPASPAGSAAAVGAVIVGAAEAVPQQTAAPLNDDTWIVTIVEIMQNREHVGR